jgi:pyruvate dehydrogenase E2 component (dihydrolipoamide acetyltransferase)
LRHEIKKTTGQKVTTNAFYIKALAKAAIKYPLVLGKLEDDRITIPQFVNVGFAVNAPQGLIVPVIKNAEEKSLLEIAALEKQLTDKARNNSITLTEMECETIALSNLGVYGVDSFFGIVPPPAAVILSVGNVSADIKLQNGSFFAIKKIVLSVAADQRILNGDYAGKFLNCVTEILENPRKLL